MAPSPLTGVLQGTGWYLLTLIFFPSSSHSIMYHFRRSGFSYTSWSLLSISLLTASLADPDFSNSPLLPVLCFTADVLYISAVTSAYLLLHWISYSSHYISGKLVLFGISPPCSGQYLFGLLRIPDHSLYKNQMLGHVSSLAKATSQKYDHTRMVSSCVDFWNPFLIAKLKSLQLQESTSPPPLMMFFARLVILLFFLPSAHLAFLIHFPFFSRDLQTSSLISNIRFSFHISFLSRTK